jgi:hypothetical protein
VTSTTASKTCFISAPAGTNLDVLRASLERRGLRVLVPHELAVGADWASEIQKQLSRSDLVIGVMTADRQSPWVLFELGQASALGRRIVLITSPKTDPIPFSLHQFVVIRTELNNEDAIGFALDQVLSAPEASKREASIHAKPLIGLGTKSDDFLETLERSLATNDWRSLEQIVGDALRLSGADVVVPSPMRDVGADLAVWSDVLEPFVGNPLLIEVKSRLNGKADATRAIKQLASYIGASGSRWALLLYGEGPDIEGQSIASTVPNILVISIRTLLESLRTRAFPELVRDLRNQRVHGAIS